MDDAVLQRYLDDVDGQFFVYSRQDIYVLAQDLSLIELESAAYNICDIILDGHSLSTQVEIHALKDQKQSIDKCTLRNERFFQNALLKSCRSADGSIVREDSRQIIDFAHYAPAKVLLVEDDRTTRNMVKTALEDACDMITAPDVSRGLTTFLSMDPDVVFLDIGLPDGSGHQVLDFIMWHNPDAYVVMFSSQDDEENVSRAMNLGAKGFISKPFVKDQMLDHLLQKSSQIAA